jgi:outer membrane protein TolC
MRRRDVCSAQGNCPCPQPDFIFNYTKLLLSFTSQKNIIEMVRFIILLICLFSTISGVCQTPSYKGKILPLSNAQELALSYNKQINQSKLLFEQTGYDLEAYKSNRFPRINLIATDFYSTANSKFGISGGNLPIYVYNPAAGQYVPNVTVNPDGSYTMNEYAYFPDIEMKFKMKNMLIGGLQVMQPIYTGGKITSAINMAEIGREMASVNIRLSEDEVIVKVDEAYMQAVRAKELVIVAESYYTMLEELERTVESAVRHGLRLRNDLMKVQVKKNEAELGHQKAENGFLLARMNLCHLTGLPLTEASSIDIETETANKDRLTPKHTGGVEYRPEYTLLEKKVALAEQEVKLTRSDYLPNVALFGSVMYANGGELAGKKFIDNGSGSVGVLVKVPLYTFGEGSNKVRSAKAKAQLAAIELSEKTELMELEIALCRTTLEECEKEVAIAKKSYEQASENLRVSISAYDNGMELLSDYFDAQALWRESAATLVEARCQLFLAYTKLLKATGQLR